ncbi:MAG: hypothetical protein QM817_30575 [Archangium sp.]
MLVFGLALLLAQTPAAEDKEYREALKRNAAILKRDAEMDAAFNRELADWKAGKASTAWGPLLDEPDEVSAGHVKLDLFAEKVTFRPTSDVRPLDATERAELQSMLRSGVFLRSRPSPGKCGFNPSLGLFWKKGEQRGSLVVCFECCQSLAENVGIASVDCQKLEAWAVKRLLVRDPKK